MNHFCHLIQVKYHSHIHKMAAPASTVVIKQMAKQNSNHDNNFVLKGFIRGVLD